MPGAQASGMTTFRSSSPEAGHHVSDALRPFLLAQPLQSLDPDMILVGGPLVRKAAELPGRDGAIHNHAGTEAGSEAQEEHLPAFVASQGLHGRIVDDLRGTPECGFEINSAPPRPRLCGFASGRFWRTGPG